MAQQNDHVTPGKTGAHSDSEDHHHVIEFGTYIRVFTILIGLTFLTVLASRFDFGEGNTIIAFAIATVKALLVLSYFMHLKYDTMLNRFAMVSAVFFLIVLYCFCRLDFVTRIIHNSVL
jgi:cytochrome c oxidase subunit 4